MPSATIENCINLYYSTNRRRILASKLIGKILLNLTDKCNCNIQRSYLPKAQHAIVST